ncbi:MAG: sprT domain-containing protein [Bacteroidetes bacterium]|nr:MAG: sprT domain-containing protein [Bacteroidota bacterium]REK05336.1 MAG: sprT domain-containing protein [Bacteroidota bacterium]REK36575.1 MAG: sprT domain-containing protein [Bacteroidota bacterium]REK51735.1 MAG: sprT domain-containing protein [Bacteroidota bacterium]
MCALWITEKSIHLKITRGRATKYGDYKPLGPGKGHHISVNHDLNPYSFLITFIHEVAHLHCFNMYGQRHDPHGREWKNEFGYLLGYFIQQNVFPQDMEAVLKEYLKNPSASSCSDPDLHRILKKYDQSLKSGVIHLEELPRDSLFYLHQSKSGQLFKKGKRLRTRFHCLELNSGREYLVNALSEVVPAANSH